MADRMQKRSPAAGIVGWFAANPVAANLLMILVIALGVMESTSLRKEAFPSLEPDSLTISVYYNSGSAQQAEEGLAIKIEEQLEDVIGIKRITSTATSTGVIVTVEKKSNYDLERLRQDVKAKIDAISTFPADAKKPVIEKAEREEHSIWLQLYGDVDRHTLQQLANDLKSDLLNHASVNRVSISGWLDPMMSVEIDEARLQAFDLSLSDVEDAINRSSSAPMSAVLRNETTYLQLQAAKQAYVAADFAAIPLVTTSDGREVLLGDVARIRDIFDEDAAVLSRFNGHNSIAVEVITTGQDDITKTVDGAREVLASWTENGKLPAGVELASWYDRSTSISERLQLLVKNAGTGIALVFGLLALFLNVRVAFWVAAGLPFIFFGTLYFMGWVGLTLNEFTTFGFIMALGIVVDDAVVIGESIYAVRRSHGDTLANTIEGTMRVAIPTLFGVFTTVAAFFALSNISGRLGELYSQFAIIVTICLILSVIESKLILPAHLAHLNTHRSPPVRSLAGLWQFLQHGADWLLTRFNDVIYARAIRLALNFRYAVIVLFLALLVFVLAMPFNGMVRMSFFPDIAGETVRAQITMQNDASYGFTHANLERMEQQAYDIDRELGGGDGPGYISDLQVMSEADRSGTVTVELADDAPYRIDTFTRLWRARVGTPEGARTINVQHSPRMVDAVRIELRATDGDMLDRAGRKLKAALQNTIGVSGIEDNLEPGQPQMVLELTPQGRAMGFTSGELANQLMQAFSGQIVQRYQRRSDEIEVKVRYPEEDRSKSVDVINARLRTNDGTIVPLSSVATVRQTYTRDSITRIDGKRAVHISADVDKDVVSATELVNNLKNGIASQLARQYPDLDIHFGGEAEQQAETQTSMLQMSLIALLIIFILLAIPLKSYVQPVLIMTAIPFGIVGAILGHWINDLSLGILSLNGIIALSGVVVNDSLLLVARFNDMRPDASHIHEAISAACRSRLRAVLLTSLTTFAGLMPLLGETSFQAQFLIPAAVSLAYGILFATIITLILIPALLAIQHDVQDILARVFHRFTRETKEPC